MRFEFATATRIVFGPGTLAEAGRLVGEWGRRAIVVTGRNPVRAQRLLEILAAAGIATEIVTTDHEPSIDDVARGSASARAFRADAVIGFGGGSAIDAAKAVAGLLTNDGAPLDYLEVVGQGRPLTRPAAPWMAIPTTAGTGAEVTRNAVLAVPGRGVKASLRSPHLLARVALVDPELTLDLPPALTAGTGLDALTHAIEALHAMQAEPIADALALHAIRLIGTHLRVVMKSPADIVSRGQMLIASTMAGMAFDNAQVGLVHAIAHTIGARHHVHHGTANAIALPHVMRFNADVAAEPYRAAGSALGIDTHGLDEIAAVEKIATAVSALIAEVGLPMRYRDVGVKESDLELLAELTLSDGAIVYNPKPVTEAAEVMTVLRAAF
jgi:alcohol dehydrogenase class IV